MADVTVVADKFGNTIGVFKMHPEYGYVRIRQKLPVINKNGWLRMSIRYGFIKGLVEDLKEANLYPDKIISGKIIVKESLEPFSEENPEKHLKIAGSSGVVCTINDQPIYRDTIYTTNEDARDVYIDHDNSDQIIAAQKDRDDIINNSSL